MSKYKQERLSAKQKKLVEEAWFGVGNGFAWGHTVEGHSYWAGVYDKLYRKMTEGTSDGRPLETPEEPEKTPEPNRCEQLEKTIAELTKRIEILESQLESDCNFCDPFTPNSRWLQDYKDTYKVCPIVYVKNSLDDAWQGPYRLYRVKDNPFKSFRFETITHGRFEYCCLAPETPRTVTKTRNEKHAD